MATVDELEQRIIDLEARLVQPLAVAPVTVGELTDVPAPGSPIASQWAQEVSGRVVHRFATVAARDAAYPAGTAGTGAICAVTATDATGGVYVVRSGVWSRPWSMAWGYIASAQTTTANSGIIAAADIPSLIITPTLLASRRYQIQWKLGFISVGAIGRVDCQLTDQTNTQFDTIHCTIGSGETFTAFGSFLLTGTAATYTFKVRAGTNSAGGSVNTSASASSPGTLQCFDVGAV